MKTAELLEGEVTIGQLLKKAPLPKTIMVGAGGYFLQVSKVAPTRVIFSVGRMLDDDAPQMSVTVSLGRFLGGSSDKRFLVQAHGDGITTALNWEQRSVWVALDVNPLTPEFLRTFMQGVLSRAGLLKEDKKEDGVKKSYLDFKGSSRKKELKDEMKREIKRFSKMDSKDKSAYPDDWTADQKYKAELKKKGRKLPKSSHTSEYHRRYGK